MTRGRTYAFAALAATDALLAANGLDCHRRLTKPLLMPTLIPGRDRATQRALACGLVGDVALLGSSEAAFKAGLGSFLVGHLAWIAALRAREGGGQLKAKPALVGSYLVAFAGMSSYLRARTGQDRIPVAVYGSALLAMALVALDTGSSKTATGGAMFLISDALIGLEKFGDLHLPGHEGLVMATYTAAQALLDD